MRDGLSSKDYRPIEAQSIHASVNNMLREIREALDAAAPHGTWEPKADGLLGQLSEADDLIASLYYAAGRARRDIATVDHCARERLLQRTQRNGSSRPA
ncbi:hypothetical protein [Streptomyces sp. 891-h]|uniref:hypothetical protein n=1 Tax=Streptomyces sp. 891-h TaxID=2720714 RepID=UPI001FA9A1A4|nr:hypothetical protein [Streptomyces sp. 891-h]UNZ22318.1 hypothetical protein HC362_34700 [Streptomyces sp. 891-h]